MISSKVRWPRSSAMSAAAHSCFDCLRQMSSLGIDPGQGPSLVDEDAQTVIAVKGQCFAPGLLGSSWMPEQRLCFSEQGEAPRPVAGIRSHTERSFLQGPGRAGSLPFEEKKSGPITIGECSFFG